MGEAGLFGDGVVNLGVVDTVAVLESFADDQTDTLPSRASSSASAIHSRSMSLRGVFTAPLSLGPRRQYPRGRLWLRGSR